MPSEKMKSLRNVTPRETLFHQQWSGESGDSSLTISRTGDRWWVTIAKEWGGRHEVELSSSDAADMIVCLQTRGAQKPTLGD